ncbi:MAG: hypothetical protein PHU27_11380 [Salinivirgaceae bacterium]|nr:hypothetical protein [Salinivirgaceae bacterium]MDY0281031.1 hypothetical protein [Salinivirgaceae bacterium]
MKTILPIIVFLIGSIVSCNTASPGIGDQEVARYKDHFLTFKELDIPDGLSKEDSVEYATRKIQNWFVKNALFEKAVENVDGNETLIEMKVENYRISLYIHEYKQKLVDQKVDTVVTHSEVEEYYAKYGDEFRLNTPIVQSYVVTTPISITNQNQLLNLLRSNTESSLVDLKTLCFQSARYYRFDSIWKPFSSLLVEVSGDSRTVSMDNLYKGKIIRFSNNTLDTYIKVIDYLNIGDKTPMNYVYDQIRNIIVRKRKDQFLSRLENDLLQNALNHKKALIQ